MILYGMTAEQICALMRLERDNQNFETLSSGDEAPPESCNESSVQAVLSGKSWA